jgi:ankyrin repeat protein
LEEGEIEVDAPGAAERRPLHRAAGGNHKEICSYLIEKGAKVDQTDKSGRTALHWAAISGHKEAAEFLLGKGADMMAVTSSKMTPLHGACEGGRLDIVTLLLTSAGDKKEAACNALDDDGKTPCALALAGSHKPVISKLKELGDPNAASVACVIS